MAASNYQLYLFVNGRVVRNTKDLEPLFKSLSVSADGNSNGLDISEASGKFNFNSKVLAGIGSGTANGEALSYTQRGANNGLASLDAGGKVPVSQLPSALMTYEGAFNPALNVPHLTDSGIFSARIVQDLKFKADVAGTGGDAISIAYTAGATAGSEVVTVLSNAISVQIETGVSTATQVKAAIDAFPAAAALVDVSISGTGSNAQVTQSAVNLAGGKAIDAGMVYLSTAAGSVNFGSGSITFAVGDWVVYNGSIWEKSSNSNSVVSVNGQTGVVSLTTSDISEGANLYYTAGRFNTAFSGKTTTDLAEGTNLYYTAARFNTAFSGKSTSDLSEGSNLYFTDARARTAVITQVITNGVTDRAPSEDAVFDALAGKASTSHTHVAADVTDFTAAARTAAVADALADGVTNVAPSQNAVFDALALKKNLADEYASFTNAQGGAVAHTVRQVVYQSAFGSMVHALASNSALNEGTVFAMVRDATIADTASGTYWLPGKGVIVGGFTGLTNNTPVYMSRTSAGGYIQSLSGFVAGESVVVLGIAKSSTELEFNPQYEFVFG